MMLIGPVCARVHVCKMSEVYYNLGGGNYLSIPIMGIGLRPTTGRNDCLMMMMMITECMGISRQDQHANDLTRAEQLRFQMNPRCTGI